MYLRLSVLSSLTPNHREVIAMAMYIFTQILKTTKESEAAVAKKDRFFFLNGMKTWAFFML